MKTWEQILDEHGITEKRRGASEGRARAVVARMKLAELRKARALTQQALAVSLQITQASISEMENRADTYVSTLRRFIEAIGGELRIVAHFPDGDVEIEQFASAGDRLESSRIR